MFEKIKNIICEQFAVDEDYVTPDTNLVDDLGADSLDMVDLAMTLEDEFLQEVLLDFEVADVLKVETLRMLIERNEDMEVGLVLCNIYRRVPIYRIKIGRKRRKKFIGFCRRGGGKANIFYQLRRDNPLPRRQYFHGQRATFPFRRQ